MQEIKAIFFDLDGTLTDSGKGIINGVKYALDKLGVDVAGRDLQCFIGPPLFQQFQDFCGISEEESKRAVELYREYYSETGIFENRLYPGIKEMLEKLRASGLKLYMATSKPEKYAKIIAEHFEIAEYFTYIGGALMDGSRIEKPDIIRYVMRTEGITEAGSVLMVGDRNYDIEGAKECGVHSMGVLFGYGSREELEQAGAEILAESAQEIAEKIL